MADVKIKTNTAQLKKGTTQILADLNVIREQLNLLRSQGAKLCGYWRGEGHDEFQKKFNNDCKEIQEFITEVGKYHKDIQAVIKNYEKGEKEIVELAMDRSAK